MNIAVLSRQLLLSATVLVAGAAQAETDAEKSAGGGLRYTFSWPLDADAPKPRGGTTKGPAVQLDRVPSVAWQSLQERNLAPLERDRRAILAMAGEYRVTFDFLEVTPFVPRDKLDAPYQSWGTEKVYVDSDNGKTISLVHMLEMRVIQQDGSVSEPMVTKHWRQDWQYEPTHVVEYRGNDKWERRKLSAADARGAWSQTVYQVDESPRYGSVGRWQHSASLSTWLSGDTWRPLPRREWSVRTDYHVLTGTNRHTILPTGWVQEENNLKAALTPERALDPDKPYVGREYGVARYERIFRGDFAAADRYYQNTKQFWDSVRGHWGELFVKRGEVTLRGPVDKLGLFRPLFARADTIAEQGRGEPAQDEKIIRDAFRDMGAALD
jgi:hypothetical protein